MKNKPIINYKSTHITIGEFAEGWWKNRKLPKHLKLTIYNGNGCIKGGKDRKVYAVIAKPVTWVYDISILATVGQIVECWNHYNCKYQVVTIEVTEKAPLPMCYDSDGQ